jgi:hypothetical protein
MIWSFRCSVSGSSSGSVSVIGGGADWEDWADSVEFSAKYFLSIECCGRFEFWDQRLPAKGNLGVDLRVWGLNLVSRFFKSICEGGFGGEFFFGVLYGRKFVIKI